LRSFRIFLFALVIAGCSRANPNNSLAIVGATIIDVRDGSRSGTGTILIDNGQITAVASDSATPMPNAAKVIDARGKFLIPGLWDMHTHIQNERELDVFFPLLVANGIVGIRDCEGLFPSEFKNLGQKLAYQPHVFASGKAVDGPAPAGTADAATVDELADKGVDFIKVFSKVPRERFLAIMKRAKERGLRVAGHIPTAVSAAEASDAGLSTMEHFNEILVNVSTREDELRARRLAALNQFSNFVDVIWDQAFPPVEPLLSTWSDAKADALFAKFVKNGTWQTPTLELYRVWTMAPFDDPAYWSNPDLSLVPGDWRESWRGENNQFVKGKPAAERAALRGRTQAFYQSQLDVARRMHKAGVKFLAGTDVSQWNYMVPGISLHDELARLVEAGLTPLEALQTATINPAEYLNMIDAGTIELHKRADLLILDADPTVDIKNTRRISTVVLGGHPIPRLELDDMFAAARKLGSGSAVR
jgi:hypothetical protein